jgi:hypothetical protein
MEMHLSQYAFIACWDHDGEELNQIEIKWRSRFRMRFYFTLLYLYHSEQFGTILSNSEVF